MNIHIKWLFNECMLAISMIALIPSLVCGQSLPAGMQRLEYITSTGTQYIVTGLKLHAPSDVVHMRFMPTAIGQGGVLFGNRVTAASKCFIAHYNSKVDFGVNINNSSYANNRWLIGDYTQKFDARKMLDIEAGIMGITVTIDGVPCGPKVPKNQDVFETEGPCTILKGVVTGGGDLPNGNGVIGNLYSFSVVSNGVAIIDLVPAIRGETVGMYDFVSGQLFENAGTGSFIPGPRTTLPTGMVRLGYITSTGEQFIDTGCKLSSPSDTVRMRFKPVTIGSGGVLFGNRVSAFSKCYMAHYNSKTDFIINISDTDSYAKRWSNADYAEKLDALKMLEVDASASGMTVTIGGVVCGPKIPRTKDVFETEGSCTILKGVVTGEGGTLPNENGVAGDLYSFSILRDGEKVLDLVPVKSGEMVGMYDLVAGRLFENAGSGSFAAGPESDGELIVAGVPSAVGQESEDAIVPAVGSVFLAAGETKVCRAFSVTNLYDQAQASPVFYTLEMFDERRNTYLPPVTNFETTCSYVQGETYTRARLTWHWVYRKTLRVGKKMNGSLCVNGIELADCKKLPLPNGYVRLDYVESRGASWVDTQVVLKSPSDHVYMKYTFANDPNDKGGVLFGSRVSANDRCFQAHYNNCKKDLCVTVDSSSYTGHRLDISAYAALQNFQGTTLEFDASIDSLVIWSNARNAKANYNISSGRDAFETAGTCMLFKGVKPDVAGASLPNENVSFGRLHRFRIRRNGSYVADLVPVRSSEGVVGLYDHATGRFLRSEGPEDFVPGPEICEVYVDQDLTVTLSAEPRGCFREWVGDVTDEEVSVNPLVKSLLGWEMITPKFTTGLLIMVR